MSNTTAPKFTLTTWQKKQAAMLYRFASLDYLKGLQAMVNNLINGVVDPTLDLAKAQQRDKLLVDARWGTRNTSENWANNAWPFLKDLQLSIAKDIAKRAFEGYDRTGVNECFRGLQEYSLAWSTPDEEDAFDAAQAAISKYANAIDSTLDHTWDESKWDDATLWLAWEECKADLPTIPKFKVRTDVLGETAKRPIRTGVYVPVGDPYGSLQFAWTGEFGDLLPSNTFNDLGLEALAMVGRDGLWLESQAFVALANSSKYLQAYKQNYDNHKDRDDPVFARSFVWRNAFTPRPCKWYFVEIVNGEFEDVAQLEAADANAAVSNIQHVRVEGGSACPQAGWYFTPAQASSRRFFAMGAVMPDFKSSYGATIWQWDPNQSGPKL
jgi:hypothetical protein